MAKKRFKIPVMGPAGCGKTCFLVTLGYLASRKRWGTITPSTSIYYGEVLPDALKGTIVGSPDVIRKVDVHFTKIEKGDRVSALNHIFETADISGGMFEAAINQAAQQGGYLSNEVTGPLKKFQEVVKQADALIVMVDISHKYTSKDRTEDSSYKDKIRAGFLENFKYVHTGITIALQMNKHFQKGKIPPIFFIFPKADLHCLADEELRFQSQILYSTLLATVDKYNIFTDFRGYAKVMNTDDPLQVPLEYGIDSLVYDIVRSIDV